MWLHGLVFPNLSATLHSLVSEKFWLIVPVLLQNILWLTLVYWFPDPRMADVSLNFSIWNPSEKVLLWSSNRPVRGPAGIQSSREIKQHRLVMKMFCSDIARKFRNKMFVQASSRSWVKNEDLGLFKSLKKILVISDTKLANLEMNP